jgi:hypothetical protein
MIGGASSNVRTGLQPNNREKIGKIECEQRKKPLKPQKPAYLPVFGWQLTGKKTRRIREYNAD